MLQSELGRCAQQRKLRARFGPEARWFGGKGALRAVAASVAMSVLFGGCATLLSKDPASLVAERAQERWQALIEKDLARAYTFLSEGTRQAISLERYQSGIKAGMWRKVEVEGVDCRGTVCKARLLVTYDHKMMKDVTTPLSEDWIIENGNAWLVLTK